MGGGPPALRPYVLSLARRLARVRWRRPQNCLNILNSAVGPPSRKTRYIRFQSWTQKRD